MKHPYFHLHHQHTKFPVLLSVLLFLFHVTILCGQEAGNFRITDVSSKLSDDSLRIRFTLRAKNLKTGSQESLTLYPRLTDGKISAPLPAIVYSGGLRKKYDARKRVFSTEPQFKIYRTYTDVRREREYTLEYESAVAYSPRLANGNLVIEYRYDDCCNSFTVREETYALKAVISGAIVQNEPVTEPLPAEKSGQKTARTETQPRIERVYDTVHVRHIVMNQVPKEQPTFSDTKRKKETLYLEFPQNSDVIVPGYGKNRAELARIDQMLNNYRGTVWITAYASPEGPFARNERLAAGRAEHFRHYLWERYGLLDVVVSHVAEDWEGLKAVIAAGNFLGKWEAIDIIDRTGVWEGREKKLMDLRGGEFWKQVEPYFRQLRRIEVEISDEE